MIDQLRTRHPHRPLATCCALLGVSPQAYYQHQRRFTRRQHQHEQVLAQVGLLRQRHPRLGGRKLLIKLQPFLRQQGLKLGRDAFFNLLAEHDLLVARRLRPRTTYSQHWQRKWPNLLKNWQPTAPHQLWVSDITYWQVKQQTFYLSLITDAYSHYIVGYELATSLHTRHSLLALRKALAQLPPAPERSLTHHSDRGFQYCSGAYVALLETHTIRISMSESGSPYDNALAERVNGILKEEYLKAYTPHSLTEGQALLEKVIGYYNRERPHSTLGLLTPEHVHLQGLKAASVWKKYPFKPKKSSPLVFTP